MISAWPRQPHTQCASALASQAAVLRNASAWTQQLCSSADVLSLCLPGEPCEEETSEVNIELLWEITNCRNSSKVFLFSNAE